MGNKKDPNAPICNWTPAIELKFLKMLHDYVLSHNDRKTINPDWKQWSDELATDFGHPVTPLQLRSKKERFKSNWDAYKHLQSTTSLGWDPVTKTVSCPDNVVDSFKQKYKGGTYVLKHGLDHVNMYEVIFDTHGSASMTFDAGTTEVLADAKNTVDVESRSSPPGVAARSHGISKKRSKNHKGVESQATEALKLIAQSISARYLSSKSGEGINNRSVLLQCQDIMEAMSVDNDLYFRALEFFKTDKDWCEVFINMSSERRESFLLQKLPPID